MTHHILVVDDEAQIRELLTLYFQKHGYATSTASTSEETLRTVAGGRVDVVVLDIGLDEEDGLKLLSTLKRDYPTIRVVMLTGMGFVDDLVHEALQKGADGYVSKVLPLDELLQAVERTLQPVSR